MHFVAKEEIAVGNDMRLLRLSDVARLARRVKVEGLWERFLSAAEEGHVVDAVVSCFCAIRTLYGENLFRRVTSSVGGVRDSVEDAVRAGCSQGDVEAALRRRAFRFGESGRNGSAERTGPGVALAGLGPPIGLG